MSLQGAQCSLRGEINGKVKSACFCCGVELSTQNLFNVKGKIGAYLYYLLSSALYLSDLCLYLLCAVCLACAIRPYAISGICERIP